MAEGGSVRTRAESRMLKVRSKLSMKLSGARSPTSWCVLNRWNLQKSELHRRPNQDSFSISEEKPGAVSFRTYIVSEVEV